MRPRINIEQVCCGAGFVVSRLREGADGFFDELVAVGVKGAVDAADTVEKYG